MILQQRVEFLPAEHTDFILSVRWNEVGITLALVLAVLTFIWWRRRRRGRGSAGGAA